MRTSKIILTADDYGACDFIDQAILKAIEAGKINSVGCFAVPFEKGPDNLEERIGQLLALHNRGFRFAVSLHFSLTAGRSNIESTYRNGNSLTEYDHSEKIHYFRNAYNYQFNHISEEELKTELLSQINRLEKLIYPLPIDSISNHHGIVYMNNRLFKAYADIAAEKQIPIRSPRIWRKAGLPYRDWDSKPFNPLILEGVKLRLVDQLRSAANVNVRLECADQKKLLYPTCLVDELYGQPYKANLKGLIEAYKIGLFTSEFMFHLGDPEYRNNQGFNSNEAYKLYEPWGIDASYFHFREEELNVLMNTHFPEEIEKVFFRELQPSDKEYPDWFE